MAGVLVTPAVVAILLRQPHWPEQLAVVWRGLLELRELLQDWKIEVVHRQGLRWSSVGYEAPDAESAA
jgi:hypothetical protein